VFALVPNRRRRPYVVAATGFLALVVLARMYLGVDTPIAMAASVVLAGGVAALTFRSLAPERRAFDRTGALVDALRDQLGAEVDDIHITAGLEHEPAALHVNLRNGAELEGHLHTHGQRRASHWHRLTREVFAGLSNDEPVFRTPREVAVSEDYALRLLSDSGIPVAPTRGIVEVRRDREYAVITDRIADTRTLGDPVVDVAVIDDGLHVVRRLRDLGVSHGDLGPHTIVVTDGRLRLADVTSLTVRPTAPSHSLDLVSMMLSLALVAYPDQVYERATRFFSPDEIADAFATVDTRALPAELAARVHADGRPLLERFRSLAPARPVRRPRRWTVRRIAVTFGTWLALNAVAVVYIAALRAGLP
jgi:hypothetical protein